ncbi:unnamed protein product [marine sediment metagenome]|uniref:Uncharacterized protein n=1 Tax=marine sediment metagenome TaxID=412755 RepID=X0VRT9_9ZZZZ
MSFMIKRKTFKIGQSHAVTLPVGWCNYYGDRIKTLTILGHNVLILAPQGLEDTAQRLIEEMEASNK